MTPLMSRMRNRYLLLLDVPLIWIAALAAFVLRFDLRFSAYRTEFYFFIIAATIAKPTIFFAARVYTRYWPYASVADMVRLVVATTVASAVVAIALVLGLGSGAIPSFSRSVLFIDWLVTTVLICGLRLSARLLSESQRRGTPAKGPRKRVLIAGAGEAGVIVARDLLRNPQLGLQAVGFLDDAPAKIGKWIAGLPVLGSLDALPAAAAAHDINEVVIAMPTAPGKVIRNLADQCRTLSIASKVIPGVFEMVGGQVTVRRLREVQIADLLRRSHARPAFSAYRYITDRAVLVTGAGGSIGREICRQVAHLKPKTLILLGHGENSLFDAHESIQREYPGIRAVAVIADVRNEGRLQRVFSRVGPEVVFHAAAHKHVPLMEENPEEALTNNAVGSRNVVRAALAAGTERLVFISTDKAAAPVSVMGAAKRLAEEIVRQSALRFDRSFMVVRFGNVLGSRGSAVPIFQSQIERGGPITITHPDMKRYFMTIPEAAHLVLEAGALGRGGELFVLRMGEPLAIVDLARDMIRLSGADTDVPIVFTGVRPGEKINEILWEEGALVEPTEHPDIVCVRERGLADDVDWAAAAEHLASVATNGSRDDLVAELRRYLPTFGHVQRGPVAPV